MHFTFLVNPAASSGQAVASWQVLESYLKEQATDYEVRFSQRAGDIKEWTRLFAKYQQASDQTLVIVGGDGSLNEAINGAMAYSNANQLPLAYIPAGSGNDFARARQLPTDPVAGFKRILTNVTAGTPERIDIGEYVDAIKREHRYFVNNVGIGFDATTVKLANASTHKKILNKLKLGKLVYLSALFKTFSLQDTFQIELDVNQRRHYFNRGYLLTLSNHPYFGGGMKIMPDADERDGLIDLIVIERPKVFIKLFVILAQLMRGKHYQYKEVHRFTATQIRFRTARLEFGHADGEELGSRAFDMVATTQPYPFW